MRLSRANPPQGFASSWGGLSETMRFVAFKPNSIKYSMSENSR